MTPNSEDIKAQADNEAKVTNRFIRIIQLKDLPWEKDSIARAANDPEHIPDCNVKATVGQHFLFHEPIPRVVNGQGYLRVTTKSLWWQHEQFPKVWTAEGLSTCSENGYDDRPFIVLTETKPSKRHIPVWARYSPLRTRVEAYANTLSP